MCTSMLGRRVCSEAGRLPISTFPLHTCSPPPPNNLKPLLDFSRAWWSVSLSPVLFTHVLPLNIECDCLKSW